MSANGEKGDLAPQEVIDEDGDVDKAIKRRIVKARERLDETEMALYRDEELNPEINISNAKKVQVYSITVRQFLRRIEPLFRVDGIENNDYYYNNIEIYENKFYPPDWEGYPFSILEYEQDKTDQQLRRIIGLPPGVELPEPFTLEITGLKEIIEREPIIQKRWEVCTANSGAQPNHEFVYPQLQAPLPKRVYENAVRMADLFLQEAGIGLDTDTKGTEIIKNFDMSGEEPQAEYGTTDYSGNPDI